MPRYTEDQKQAAVRQFVTGSSQNQVAKNFGCSISALRSWREKYEDAIRAEVESEAVTLDEVTALREQKERAEAVQQPSVATVRDRLDGTVEPLAADAPGENLELERLRAEVANLKDELSEFRPTPVEWGWTPDAVKSNLQDHLDDMVAADLVALNRERLSNGLAPMKPAEMEEVEPGWYDRQVDKLVNEALDALSSAATDEGPAKIKLVMADTNGNLQQIFLDEGIDNGPAARVEKLRDRGWKVVDPQPCARENCWNPPVDDWTLGNLNFCGELHHQLYVSFQGQVRRGVTTSSTFAL